jgi:hypothetical protein
LLVIKTTKGKVFGAFTTENWDHQQGAWKQDGDAFIFSMDLEKMWPIK